MIFEHEIQRSIPLEADKQWGRPPRCCRRSRSCDETSEGSEEGDLVTATSSMKTMWSESYGEQEHGFGWMRLLRRLKLCCEALGGGCEGEGPQGTSICRGHLLGAGANCLDNWRNCGQHALGVRVFRCVRRALKAIYHGVLQFCSAWLRSCGLRERLRAKHRGVWRFGFVSVVFWEPPEGRMPFGFAVSVGFGCAALCSRSRLEQNRGFGCSPVSSPQGRAALGVFSELF